MTTSVLVKPLHNECSKFFSPFPVFQYTFEPIDLIDVVPSAVPRETSAIADAGAGYYSQSLYMLDAGPLKGRILLCAWDHGLLGSSEEVISLIQEAVKVCSFQFLSIQKL